MLGVTRLVFLLTGLTFEGSLEAVLGAVGLVRHHHDVAALGQLREGVFILSGHQLLNGGKDDAARGAVAQLVCAGLGGSVPGRLLAQQVLGQAEHAKELPIEVVAVGNDHDGGVFHRGFLHRTGGKAGHGDALATALGVPHHAAFADAPGREAVTTSSMAARTGVELVVARDLLHQLAVILKQDEVTDVVQQVLLGPVRHAPGFAVLETPQRSMFTPSIVRQAMKRSALAESDPIQRISTVRDHHTSLVPEHVRDLLLVRLDLVERLPDVGVLVGGVFEFQQHQRQAVDEQDDVRAAGFVGGL